MVVVRGERSMLATLIFIFLTLLVLVFIYLSLLHYFPARRTAEPATNPTTKRPTGYMKPASMVAGGLVLGFIVVSVIAFFSTRSAANLFALIIVLIFVALVFAVLAAGAVFAFRFFSKLIAEAEPVAEPVSELTTPKPQHERSVFQQSLDQTAPPDNEQSYESVTSSPDQNIGKPSVQDVWYYADRNGQVGPLSLQKLRETLASFSTANASDVSVWHAGFEDWKFAKDVPELGALQTPPPPPLVDLRPLSPRLN